MNQAIEIVTVLSAVLLFLGACCLAAPWVDMYMTRYWNWCQDIIRKRNDE